MTCLCEFIFSQQPIYIFFFLSIGYVKLKELFNTDALNGSPTLSTNDEYESSIASSDETYVTLRRRHEDVSVLNALNTYANELPRSCYEVRKIKKMSDLPEDVSPDEISENDLFEKVSYVNSRSFMTHFFEDLYPEIPYKKIGLAEDCLTTKKIRGKVVRLIKDEGISEVEEIIPCFTVKWPGEQTLDFITKSQRMPVTEGRLSFPPPDKIGEIMRLGALLAPKSWFLTESRKDDNIEWEYRFPHAESYLQSCMTHSQMKMYILMLCLYKSTIATKTSEKGLLIEHIRSFFVSKLDENFNDWAEQKLGTKLLNLLKELNTLIANCELREYFIAEKKPLEHIDRMFLRENQKNIHDIQQTPLMSVIRCLRNLQYVQDEENFYAPFDFGELLRLLKQDETQVPSIPLLTRVLPKEPKRIEQSIDLDDKTKWLKIKIEQDRNRRRKEKERQKAKEDALANKEVDDLLVSKFLIFPRTFSRYIDLYFLQFIFTFICAVDMREAV